MINKLIKILFLILTFKIKYKFSIPPKKKIIVYDAFSLMMAKLFFKHKDFEIFYNRFEEINIKSELYNKLNTVCNENIYNQT